MVNYKDAACAVFAGIGAWIAQIYGGWAYTATPWFSSFIISL